MSEPWQDMTLGNCYDLISERADAPALPPECPYFGLEHLDPASPLAVAGGFVTDVSGQVNAFEASDTLFGRLRAYLRKVSFAVTGGYCSPEILVLRPRTQVVVPRFLQLLASSEDVIQQAVASSAGSRMPRTSARDLASIPVLMPPLSVQRRIVDLMEHLDNQVNLMVAERECTTQLRSALRRELRTATTLPLRTLANEDGIQIGPFGSQLHAHEYTPEGTPVVMPQDIVDGAIRAAKIKRIPESVAQRLTRHRLEPGDIVFPRRGDLSKRALVTAEQQGWICGTGCIRFRPAESQAAGLLYEGLADQAVTDWLVENAVGTTMLNLNTAIVGNLPVPDMSDVSLAFAESAAEASGTIDALTNEVGAVRHLRGCLLSALMSGDLSVADSYDDLLGVAS